MGEEEQHQQEAQSELAEHDALEEQAENMPGVPDFFEYDLLENGFNMSTRSSMPAVV